MITLTSIIPFRFERHSNCFNSNKIFVFLHSKHRLHSIPIQKTKDAILYHILLYLEHPPSNTFTRSDPKDQSTFCDATTHFCANLTSRKSTRPHSKHGGSIKVSRIMQKSIRGHMLVRTPRRNRTSSASFRVLSGPKDQNKGRDTRFSRQRNCTSSLTFS